uniref:Reverse transcriptase domain-containing protein n=1 Tax=Strigamia maritima TaxID=126957 RepID=T1JHU1_STRMM
MFLMPINDVEELIGKQSELLDRDFEIGELGRTIKSLKQEKSPGPDEMINEFFKSASAEARTIIPIYKAGDDSVASNYRGITLLNVLYKITTSLMAARIQEWVERENILTKNQAGFRKAAQELRKESFMPCLFGMFGSLLDNRR